MKAVRVPIERELDLHAFAPGDIRSLVEEYVNEAVRAGFREVRLVQLTPFVEVRIVPHPTATN